MVTRTANTMKAWRSDGRGVSDLRLETVELPTPGAGSALIQVVHAALNFSDVLMLEDRYQVRPPRPFIPGQEVAGIVVEAGPDSRLSQGDRVVSKVEWGAFAPRTIVRDDMAIIEPPIFIASAACLKNCREPMKLTSNVGLILSAVISAIRLPATPQPQQFTAMSTRPNSFLVARNSPSS